MSKPKPQTSSLPFENEICSTCGKPVQQPGSNLLHGWLNIDTGKFECGKKFDNHDTQPPTRHR